MIIPIERDGYLLRRDVATIRAAIIVLTIYCAIYLLAKPKFDGNDLFVLPARMAGFDHLVGWTLLSRLLTGRDFVKRKTFRSLKSISRFERIEITR